MPTITTPTLSQLDSRVQALETQVPQINAGLQETLRQNTLALEAEYQSLVAAVGSPADSQGNPATGLYAAFASIASLLNSVSNRLTVVESSVANINLDISQLDAAVNTLQTQVNTH